MHILPYILTKVTNVATTFGVWRLAQVQIQ